MPQSPDTADNVALREKILTTLSPKEQAIFLFVEHLAQFERDFQPEPGQILSIAWDSSRTTQQIYEEALKGNTGRLPVPYGGHYDSFGWMTWYKRDPSRKQYPTLGSSDIRIVERGQSLVFEANGSTLKGTRSWWEAATKDIEYPILVENGDTTPVYKNPAYQAVEGK
jgi:hypothetical protein